MSDVLFIHNRNRMLDVTDIISMDPREKSAFYDHCALRIAEKSHFHKDTSFWSNGIAGEYLVGVVLNSKEITNKYNTSSISEYLCSESLDRRRQPYEEMEGSYIGISIKESGKTVCIYMDTLSNYPVYYFCDDSWIIASNKIELVVKQMRHLSIPVKKDMIGFYSLLTYAYMYDRHTLVDGISRLEVGYHIEINDSIATVIKHYSVPEQIHSGESLDVMTEQIDSLFLDAIRLHALKNQEYGLTNYVALSAGMDSRMAVSAFRRLGIEEVVTYTYSETGQNDQMIPQKISRDMSYEWVFRSLDTGADIQRIQEGIILSDSRVYYVWASQLNGMMKLLNNRQMGLHTTGVIGDVIVGSFCRDASQIQRNYRIGDGAYSSVCRDKLVNLIGSSATDELYSYGMMRNRGFNGACLGYSTVFQEYTEALSPFMYKPLFDYCMSIPDEVRFGHSLYYRWVRRCYPEAARYRHNGKLLHHDSPVVSFFGRNVRMFSVPDLARDRIIRFVDKRRSMNPMQYWYDRTPRTRTTLDSYYRNHINEIEDSELQADMIHMYDSYSIMEKLLVISCIGYHERLFLNK